MNQKFMGVCPVMLTPFDEENKIDFQSLKKLTDWYIQSGAACLFAVCQSNEMFYLAAEERIAYAKFVKEQSSVPVFAVGNVETNREKALEEIYGLMEAEIDGIVLITNTFGPEEMKTEQWREAVEWYLARIPEKITLGLYECPVPYKHLISDEELRFLVDTGRFSFLKDTCCDTAMIRRRLEIIGDAPFSLFNANSTTLLETLKAGSAGFCGILANFNTRLCVWLCENWKKYPREAEYVQSVLAVASKFGDDTYPVNAKAYLCEKHILETDVTRVKDSSILNRLNLEDLKQLSTLFACTEEQILGAAEGRFS